MVVYSGDEIMHSPDDENTMDYFIGKRTTGKTTDSKVDLGVIVRDIDELIILNDEAHHIYQPCGQQSYSPVGVSSDRLTAR